MFNQIVSLLMRQQISVKRLTGCSIHRMKLAPCQKCCAGNGFSPWLLSPIFCFILTSLPPPPPRSVSPLIFTASSGLQEMCDYHHFLWLEPLLQAALCVAGQRQPASRKPRTSGPTAWLGSACALGRVISHRFFFSFLFFFSINA